MISAVATSCSPTTYKPTHSRMHMKPSHGPQAAVPSIDPQSLKGKQPYRSKRSKLRQDRAVNRERSITNVQESRNNANHCSVHREATRSKARWNPSRGLKAAMTSNQLPTLEDTRSCRLETSEMRHKGAVIRERSNANILALRNNKVHCSVTKNVSKHWTVPLALSPTPQVINTLVIPDPTHSKAHNESSYGRQRAVTNTQP
jgi:hypothetical protein